MRAAHGFEVHALPDAGHRGVENGEGRARDRLLAAGNAGVEGIAHADDQVVFAGLQGGRGVQGEGGVASLVPAQKFAVEPHLGLVVRGAHGEQGAAPVDQIRGAVERGVIPHHAGHAARVHTGQLGLHAEGHADGAAGPGFAVGPPQGAARVQAVKSKIPLAVQDQGSGAHAVRAGMGGGSNDPVFHGGSSHGLLIGNTRADAPRDVYHITR